MKLNLPLPGRPQQRLIFSNNITGDENMFTLVMTAHESGKGGFDYPVMQSQCEEALQKYNRKYHYIDYDDVELRQNN